MKKVIGYPCTKCQKLTEGTIIAFQRVNDDLIVVRFKKDCCKHEAVRFFTELEMKHYCKEVKDGSRI